MGRKVLRRQKSFQQAPKGRLESWPRCETPWDGRQNMSSWHDTCQGPLPRLQLRLAFPRTWLRLLTWSTSSQSTSSGLQLCVFSRSLSGLSNHRKCWIHSWIWALVKEFQDPHSLTLARRSIRTVPPWFNKSFLSLRRRNWGGSLISKKEPAEGKPFFSPFFFQFYLKGLLAMVVSPELLLWA
jgi:hypothetical protein